VAVHHFKEGVINSFLIMDYVPGGDLSRRVSPGGPIPWGQAARYMAGVADALRDVHARGILHRDIKPANILWDPEPDEAVLGDFGIAVASDLAGQGGGTRGYIAPEVYWGAASFPSDVYSLSATLLHLVTGEAPRSDAAPTDYANWPALPDELRRIILAGLEPEPERRADLPRFLTLLREARWQALCQRILRQTPAAAAAVRLEATVAIARPHDPETFHAITPRHGPPLEVHTGDYVKIETVASEDGYRTVLILSASGELDLALPRPTESHHRFAASQRHTLLFRLTPPAGTERILVVWSRQVPKQGLTQWRRWLEQIEPSLQPDPRPRNIRGLEIMGSESQALPEGNWRALVIPISHRPPRKAGHGVAFSPESGRTDLGQSDTEHEPWRGSE
jgi:serine/threonine protein kinase